MLEELTAETAKEHAREAAHPTLPPEGPLTPTRVSADPFTFGHHAALQRVLALRRGTAHLEQLIDCPGTRARRSKRGPHQHTRTCHTAAANSLAFDLSLVLAGFTVNRVNLAQLYGSADPYRVLRSDEGLQRRMESRRREIEALSRLTGQEAVDSTFALYQEVVGPCLHELAPVFTQVLHSSTSKTVREHDLFIWSILQGDVDYMLFWWQVRTSPDLTLT